MKEEIIYKLDSLLSEYVECRYMSDYETIYDDELEELYQMLYGSEQEV